MKIAFMVGIFPPLYETFIINQITGLMDSGHEIDIFTEKTQEGSGIHLDVQRYKLLDRTFSEQLPINLPLRFLRSCKILLVNRNLSSYRILLRSLNIHKYCMRAASLRLFYAAIPFLPGRTYDIIHCHFGPVGLMGALLRDIGAVQGKLIVTFHGADITKYPRRFGDHVYKPLFARGDLFLPISDRWRHRLIEMGCDDNKLLVHRMGIDCERFTPDPAFIPATEPVRIVTIGRLVEKKGLQFGIHAIAELVRSGRNVEYHIVGDGPLRDQLERLIEELDLSDTVKLLGWRQQKEISEILKNSHIFLAPSVTSQDGDQEGIPVSLMEAMNMGLPVVSTHHSGINELVQDNVSGFLVPERNAKALAERLDSLVKNPKRWSEMGEQGRKCVKQHHNIKKLNRDLLEIYQRLIG